MPTTADGIVRYNSRSGILSSLGPGGEVDADSVTGTTASEMSTDERTNNSKPSGDPMLRSSCPPAVPPIMIIM